MYHKKIIGTNVDFGSDMPEAPVPIEYEAFYRRNPTMYHGIDSRAHIKKTSQPNKYDKLAPGIYAFSDWVDGTPFVRIQEPSAAERMFSMTGSITNTPPVESQRASQIALYNTSLAQAAPRIELAKINAASAARVAQINTIPSVTETQSMTPLRLAQASSTVLRARTQNLKATADVSKEMQQPVKAEAIRALPWIIGGSVALGLVIFVLYKTRK